MSAATASLKAWGGLALAPAIAVAGALAAGYLTATKTVTPLNVLSLVVVVTSCFVAGPIVLSFLFLTAGTIPLISDYGARAMGVLDNHVSPLGTLLALVGLMLVIAVLFRRVPAIGVSVRRGWGVKYVVAYLLAGFVLMPFYEHPMDQAWMLAHYFAVPILAVVCATYVAAGRTFRVTRGQLVALSFILLGTYGVLILFARATGRYLLIQPETMQYFGGVQMQRLSGLAGEWGAANDSAAMLLSLLPFALAWLEKRRRAFFWQACVLVFATYLIIMFRTRAEWLAYPVVLAVFVVGTYPLRRRLLYGLLVLVLVLGSVMTVPAIGARFADLAHTGGFSGGNANNLGMRWLGLEWTVRRVAEDPQATLIGLGGGAWERMAAAAGLALDVAHDFWATLLADGGLLAVGLWAAFFVAFFGRAVRAVRRLRPEDRLWPMSGIASMIALLIWSMSANYLNYGGPVLSVLVALMTWSACGELEKSGRPGGLSADV